MDLNTSLETEGVVSGLVTPERIMVLNPNGRINLSPSRGQTEFQRLPGDQLIGDQFLMHFLGKGALPERPKIGGMMLSLIAKLRELGEVMHMELSSALTVDQNGKVYQTSVTDISGGESAARSWSNNLRIPKGHRLLMEIHNHHIQGTLREVEGFTVGLKRGDLETQIVKREDQAPPAINVVVTPEGTYISVKEDWNGKEETSIIHRLAIKKGWKEAKFRKEIELLLKDVLGNDYMLKITGKKVRNSERKELQERVCRNYGLTLYFIKKGETTAERIV